MSFRSFQFHPRIESGIRSYGYTVPTPILLQCIPLVAQGKDVMGLAQTGTDKTGDAFTLVTPKDRSLVWDIENVLGEKMDRRRLEHFDYNVPAPKQSGDFGGFFVGGGRQGLNGFRKLPVARRSEGFGPKGGSAYGGPEKGASGKGLFSSSKVKARRVSTTRSF
jgi:hypothetical protein